MHRKSLLQFDWQCGLCDKWVQTVGQNQIVTQVLCVLAKFDILCSHWCVKYNFYLHKTKCDFTSKQYFQHHLQYEKLERLPVQSGILFLKKKY